MQRQSIIYVCISNDFPIQSEQFNTYKMLKKQKENVWWIIEISDLFPSITQNQLYGLYVLLSYDGRIQSCQSPE